MLDKQKKIKEQRTAEAISKEYMGLDGKFGIILKTLGKPILAQGSNNVETTEWRDVYELEEETIPEEDPDAPILEVGRMFSGLKFGYNIEITYMQEGTIPTKVDDYFTAYELASKVLKVYWNSYLVYLESDGELHQFLPNEEWENIINKIYGSAKKLRVKINQENIEESKNQDVKEKMSFLQMLRQKWGI